MTWWLKLWIYDDYGDDSEDDSGGDGDGDDGIGGDNGDGHGFWSSHHSRPMATVPRGPTHIHNFLNNQ